MSNAESYFCWDFVELLECGATLGEPPDRVLEGLPQAHGGLG